MSELPLMTLQKTRAWRERIHRQCVWTRAPAWKQTLYICCYKQRSASYKQSVSFMH